jgi:hypothetical protein
MLLNQIPHTNEGTHSTKGLLTLFNFTINIHLRPLEAEAGPDGALDNFLDILPFL